MPARSPASKSSASSTNQLLPPSLWPPRKAARPRRRLRSRRWHFRHLRSQTLSTAEGDIYQVLSTNGDTHLGGDDIDTELQKRLGETIQNVWIRFIDLPYSCFKGFGKPQFLLNMNFQAEMTFFCDSTFLMAVFLSKH